MNELQQGRVWTETTSGGQTIVKRMRTQEWQRLQQVTELCGSGLQPFVPAILDVMPTDDAGWVSVRMEHVGHRHLETVPTAFAGALALLSRIKKLDMAGAVQSDLDTAKSGGPATSARVPICLRSLQREIELTFQVDKVAAVLGCTGGQRRMLDEALEVGLKLSVTDDALVPAHGDFHPRNILVRRSLRAGAAYAHATDLASDHLFVIDWEYAGMHSIYRDIYALIDMCYPEATVCLTGAAAAALRVTALADAERFLGVGPGSLRSGYEAFNLLERLVECRQIAADIKTARRARVGLQHQAEYVLRDLARRLAHLPIGNDTRDSRWS